VVRDYSRTTLTDYLFRMHRGKENDTSDLEDFGFATTYASSAYPDAHALSPAKDSPSRRKKLMGSLRSVGSLRSLRSPPRKERGNERVEPSGYPEVSSLIIVVKAS
jgi:hypothetical protein